MTTRSSDLNRKFDMVGDPGYMDVPAVASDILWAGSALGLSSGYARPLSGGDVFCGFNIAKVDNSSGSDGDKNARVRTRGSVQLAVTGVTAVTDIGSTVYATDDDTFTLTASGASAIGKVARYISGTTVIVEFEADAQRSI